jgi:hypothetical protein
MRQSFCPRFKKKLPCPLPPLQAPVAPSPPLFHLTFHQPRSVHWCLPPPTPLHALLTKMIAQRATSSASDICDYVQLKMRDLTSLSVSPHIVSAVARQLKVTTHASVSMPLRTSTSERRSSEGVVPCSVVLYEGLEQVRQKDEAAEGHHCLWVRERWLHHDDHPSHPLMLAGKKYPRHGMMVSTWVCSPDQYNFWIRTFQIWKKIKSEHF